MAGYMKNKFLALQRNDEPESCLCCRWQFYGILRGAFAMHNKFLVTVVDAMEFVE